MLMKNDDSNQDRKAVNSRSRKKVVRDFFKLVVQGRQMDGLRFFAANCKQHNPYVHGGMDALFNAMKAVQQQAPKYPDPAFAIKKILADGDMIAVHTELISSKSKPSEGGLRQAHLFRFDNDNKIVEYWDITQQVRLDMPNAANAF
jgi:predicted SnoaL-like aldol condensation-catalyzing enzyme